MVAGLTNQKASDVSSRKGCHPVSPNVPDILDIKME